MFFLARNTHLEQIYLPKLEEVYFGFLTRNKLLKEISLPKVKKIEKETCLSSKILKKVYAPKLKEYPSNYKLKIVKKSKEEEKEK